MIRICVALSETDLKNGGFASAVAVRNCPGDGRTDALFLSLSNRIDSSLPRSNFNAVELLR